jgi:hypothetical protein
MLGTPWYIFIVASLPSVDNGKTQFYLQSEKLYNAKKPHGDFLNL